MTPDYLAFQTWDTTQALCSYVRGMLCQKAIMTGIGVGQEVRARAAKKQTPFRQAGRQRHRPAHKQHISVALLDHRDTIS